MVFGTRDLDQSLDLEKNRFSGKKKVNFRTSDLGESDHADSNEPPFQRPIFFKLTLPNTRGQKKRLSPEKRQNYVHTSWLVPLRFRYLLNQSMKSADFWVAGAELNVFSGNVMKI